MSFIYSFLDILFINAPMLALLNLQKFQHLRILREFLFYRYQLINFPGSYDIKNVKHEQI